MSNLTSEPNDEVVKLFRILTAAQVKGDTVTEGKIRIYLDQKYPAVMSLLDKQDTEMMGLLMAKASEAVAKATLPDLEVPKPKSSSDEDVIDAMIGALDAQINHQNRDPFRNSNRFLNSFQR